MILDTLEYHVILDVIPVKKVLQVYMSSPSLDGWQRYLRRTNAPPPPAHNRPAKEKRTIQHVIDPDGLFRSDDGQENGESSRGSANDDEPTDGFIAPRRHQIR